MEKSKMHLSNIAGVGVPELERNARVEHHRPGTIALRCDLAELRVGLRRVVAANLAWFSML